VKVTASSTDPPFDRTILLANVGGDTELFHRVTSLFKENTPACLVQMRRAIAERDGQALEKLAHTLLSSLEIFGAHRARKIARTLQISGRSENLNDTGHHFVELKNEVDRILAALSSPP
jgi:HPt (histidine-containing phosphotransfer) domain-containing protein